MKRILTVLGIAAALTTFGASTASAKKHKKNKAPVPAYTYDGYGQGHGAYGTPGKHKQGKGFVVIKKGQKNGHVKKGFRKQIRKVKRSIAILQSRIARTQSKIAFLQHHNAHPFKIKKQLRKLRKLNKQLRQNVRKLNRTMARAGFFYTPGFNGGGFQVSMAF